MRSDLKSGTPLHELPAGAHARLVSIGGDRAFRRRLMELGLLPGTELSVVRNVDVGGVMELEVRRGRLTLRRSEAREMLVAVEGRP